MAVTQRQLILLAFALPYWCAAVSTPEGLDFFEKKIQPVLSSECAECHGAKKQKGGLRVDFREGLRKGGENGAAIVPGEPAKSLLLAAIKHADPDLEMPQKRAKLSDATIADVEQWIAMGAPDPRDDPPRDDAAVPWAQVFAERKQWWCFQPLRMVDPPKPADAAWSDHPVDRFLRAAMESQAHGLTPSRDADPCTLIRRLTFILTGLPPTPAEVEAFERSPSVAQAVDRLLDSPRFGEHWARHWMDLVRYAETHGSEGDPDIPWAYLYRDYLIRAFNGDVPCDQLIREHLAGDLLPSPRWNRKEHLNESAIGTAHLRLVEHGFQPVDALDEQVKTVDSQVDVAMKAFQGLTVTCARCHDHKFDAISQRDYYALYGVFASCRPAVVTLDDPAYLAAHIGEFTALKVKVRSTLAETWLAEAEHIPERIAAVKAGGVLAEANGTTGALENWRRAWAEAAKDQNSPLHAFVKSGLEPQAEKDDGFSVVWDLAKESDYSRWIRHGSGLPEKPMNAGDFAVAPTGDRVLTALLPPGAHSHTLSSRQNGVLQSPRFRVETNFISVRAAGGGGSQVRLVVDNYPLGNGGIFPGAALDREEPQWVRLDVKYRRGSSAYLELATRKDLTRADARGPDAPPSWFTVEKVAFHDRDRVPAEEPLDAPDSPEELKERLATAIRAWEKGTLNDAEFALLTFFVRRELLPTRMAEVPAAATLATEYRKLEAEVPEPRRIAGVLDEGIDAALLPRGDHLKPGEPVPRAFLSAISGDPFFANGDQSARRASGRLALANAITDLRNPLTARVMVNRVWHWLFGRGIVGTPDNFGKMGELPSHPELLDFLAAKFSAPANEGGMEWSFKKLIRYLVTTRAFCLASEAPKGAAEMDAANIYLSHARVKRLEAESIRDTLLSVAGRLDETRFGPSDNAFAPPDKQRRRSIYLMVHRTALSPFLTVFDAPRPFSTLGRRDQTNVPAQSLTMLNDPLVHFCADEWAGRLNEQQHATPDERLRIMFLTTFSRQPTAAESESSVHYLGDERASDPKRITDLMRDRAAWRNMAIGLFNTKEFLYLR